MSSFLDGQVYMNTLAYFAALSSDPLRADPREGDAWWMPSNQATLSIKVPGGDFVPIGGLTGAISYSHPDDRQANVYCLYGVGEDSENTGIDPRVLEFGDTYVAITKPQLLFDKIADAAEKRGQKITVGAISYVDESNHYGLVGPFRKSADYAYQSEFRILMRPGLGQSVMLEIGDIREIAVWGPSLDLPSKMHFRKQ